MNKTLTQKSVQSYNKNAEYAKKHTGYEKVSYLKVLTIVHNWFIIGTSFRKGVSAMKVDSVNVIIDRLTAEVVDICGIIRVISVINFHGHIISKDKNAICASRIFSSLCKSGSVSLSDYEDLEFMYMLGYRNFMLQDDVKGETLKRVLKGFGDFRHG